MGKDTCHNCQRTIWQDHDAGERKCPICLKWHCNDCKSWPSRCCRDCSPPDPNKMPAMATGEGKGGADGPTVKVEGMPEPEDMPNNGVEDAEKAAEAQSATDDPATLEEALEALRELRRQIQGPSGDKPASEDEADSEPDDSDSDESDGQGGAAQDPTFTVYLRDPGDAKISCIKAVRHTTNLSLKESKDLVDSVGKPVDDGDITKMQPIAKKLPEPVAELVKDKFHDIAPLADVIIMQDQAKQQKQQPKPSQDNSPTVKPLGPGLIEFKMYGHFSLQSDELHQTLVDRGMSPVDAASVIEDGRFGNHGEVEFTCLLDDGQVSVIDCDYLD
jgi:ribosomal protein L7/L12